MNNNKFNIPQKQSALGILVLLVNSLQKIIRNLIPVILVFFLKSDKISPLYFFISTFILLLILVIIAYLKYINFTFYIDYSNKEFVLTNGILNKSKVVIPLDKIQQVNINQTFIQRLIGVFGVEIDTAGSATNEIQIKAISKNLALQLKEILIENQNLVSPNQTILNENPIGIKISFFTLIKMGLTSNYAKTIGIILAFLVSLYDQFNNWFKNESALQNKIETTLQGFTLSIFIFLFVTIILFVLLFNLGRTIIKYFNFSILFKKQTMLLSYGLLNIKNVVISPKKVQFISSTQNYFQKKLNLFEIKIKQALFEDSTSESKNNQTEIQGCNSMQHNQILQLLLNQNLFFTTILKPNIRKIISLVFKFQIIPIFVFFSIFFLTNKINSYYFLLFLVYLFIVFFVIFFGYKNNKLMINDSVIAYKSGVWDIETQIIEVHKIQSIALAQKIWHKKANVGHVYIYTAGGKIQFKFANFTQAKKLVNSWLFAIESNPKSWNN